MRAEFSNTIMCVSRGQSGWLPEMCITVPNGESTVRIILCVTHLISESSLPSSLLWMMLSASPYKNQWPAAFHPGGHRHHFCPGLLYTVIIAHKSYI